MLSTLVNFICASVRVLNYGIEIHEFHTFNPLYNLDRWDNGITPHARDFIEQLLVVNPRKRLTALQALKHPWLDEDEVRGDVWGAFW